jgi:hypothetical protein
MSSPELDQLLIEHLSDIDAATKQMHSLQSRVFQAVGEVAQEWADAERWVGKFDYIQHGLWLAPEAWRAPDSDLKKDEFEAFFEMDVGEGDTHGDQPNEDVFYLTRLCGRGGGMICLRFKQRIAGRLRWRKSFQENSKILSATGFLADSGPSFFLPVQIDSTALARALLDDDIESAMAPFKAALEHLKESRPLFDTIIRSLKAAEG